MILTPRFLSVYFLFSARALCLIVLALNALSAAVPTIDTLAPDTGISASDFNTKNASPTVTGTADAGSTVRLFSGPPAGALSQIGSSVVASAAGIWAIALTSVADGRYDLEARATPVLGGAALISTIHPLVIDTISAAPTGLAISPSLNQAGFTNSGTPIVTGTADPGATVYFYLDTTPVGSTVANATTGAFSFSGLQLVSGSYVITASQRDLAGNAATAFSLPLNVVVDLRTTKPLIYASSVGASGTTTNNSSPGFTGKAEPGATVQLHTGTANGPVVAAVVADGTGKWTVASVSPALINGGNTVFAVATDLAGNFLTSDPFGLIVDLIPPTAFIATNFINAGTSAPVSSPTTVRNLAWTGQVTGATTVSITLDGVAAGSASISGSNWTYSFSATLPDHTYVLVATAQDNAGNTSTPVNGTITVTDPSASAAAKFAPVILDALNSTSKVTQNPSISLAFIGRPNAVLHVDFIPVAPAPAIAQQSATLDANGSLAYSIPAPVGGGTYDVTITDIAQSLTSASYQIIFDNVPPTGPSALSVTTDTGLSSTDLITSDTTVVLNVSGVADAAPSSGNLQVTATIDGAPFGTVMGAGGGAITAPYALPDGRYTLAFSLRDRAGNQSSTVIGNQTLVIDTITETPVQLGIEPDSGQFSNDQVTNVATGVKVVGRAEPGATVSLTVINSAIGLSQTITALVGSDGKWEVSLPTFTANGTYVCTSTVVDVAGNTAGTSNTLNVVYDSTPPVTVISGFTPASGTPSGNRTNATTITVLGTSDPSAEVVVSLTGGRTATVIADGSGNWTTTFSALPEGSYTVTAIGTDTAGNISNTATAAALFVIDTTVATPSITSITNDTFGAATPTSWGIDLITSDDTLAYDGAITGTRQTTDILELVIGGTVVSTQTGTAASTWNYTEVGARTPGTYAVIARLTDDVGNVAEVTRTLIIDQTLPTAAITSVAPDSGFSTSDFVTNATVLTALSGTAADNVRTGLVRVELRLSGVDQFSSAVLATLDGAGGWSVPGTGLPPLIGNPPTTYQIVVTPTDAAGNLGLPVTQNLVIDNVPPAAGAAATIASYSVSFGRTQNGSLTNDATPTLAGTTVNADPGGYVTIYSDASATVVLGTALLDGGGNFSFTSPARADGLTTYFARVFDSAGNPATLLSSSFAITVDTTNPVLAIVAITDDTAGGTGTTSDFITRDTQPIFTGTVSDLHLTNVAVTLTPTPSGAAIFTNLVAVISSGGWTLDRSAAAALPDGTYILSVTAVDDVTNSTTVTQTVVIDTQVSAPVSTLTPGSDLGTSNSDRVTKDNTPTYAGSAEPGAAVTVVFTPPTGAPVTVTVFADNTGAWTATPTALPDAVYTVTTTQIDRAGNGPSAATTSTLTIDTVTPIAPTIALETTSDSGVSNSDHITQDTTPTFTATAEPNAEVTLTFTKGATVVVVTVTANGSGVWSATPGVLAQGTWTVTAKQTDLAGNGLSAAATLAPTLIIDTAAAPPAITAVITDSARVGSDAASLASGSDFRTNDTTLTLRGTAEPGATVELRRNGTSLGTVVADVVGGWTLSDALVQADGATPMYTAVQTDVAGNLSGLSTGRTVTVDLTAPLAVISGFASDTGSSSSDGITNDRTLVITGTTEAGALVTVFIDGSVLGTALANGSGAWSFGPSVNQTEGVHAITATATDVANNTGAASAATVVTIDATAPPTPALTSLASGDDTGVSAVDLTTNKKRPAIIGTGEPGATITIRDNGAIIGTAVVQPGGTWSFTPTSDLADGSHPLTATATDTAGNVSAAGGPLTILIDTAVVAPVITGISEDRGTSSSDLLTNDTTLTVSGTAEPGAAVELFDGAVSLGIVTAGTDGVWRVAATFSEASHPLTAVAVDRAGNVSVPSASRTVIVDLTPPSAAVASIAGDTGSSATDAVTNDPTLIFSGTGEVGATVTVRLDGVVIGTALVNGSGAWTFDYTAVSLASGTYAVTVSATDQAGNTGAISAPLTVVVDRQLALPVVRGLTPATDTGSSSSDGITSNQTPTIFGSSDPGSVVSVTVDGVVVGSVVAAADGAWTFSLSGSPLANGDHLIGAVAMDIAGNTATAITYPVRVNTAIANPAVTGIAPDTGTSAIDRITSATAPTATGSGVPGAIVTVRLDGVVVGTTTVASNGAWSVPLPAKTDGDHVIVASQQDLAGNVGTSLPVTYTIDTVAPAAPVTTGLGPDTGISASDGVTSATSPILSGTGEVGALIRIFDNGDLIGTTIVQPDGTWAYRTTLSEGIHSLTTTAMDVAGNQSAPSLPTSVTIDITPPAVAPISSLTPDTGRSPTDRVTSATAPSIAGVGEPGARVELYDGATLISTAIVASDGTWQMSPTWPAGIHTLHTVAIDSAGNRGPSSADVVLEIDITAPLAPVIRAISGDTGASVSDAVTADNSLIVSGTAEPGAEVALRLFGAVVGRVIAASDGTWSIDLTARVLPDATYAVTATAEDLAGNQSVVSPNFPVVVDTAIAPPQILGFVDDTGIAGDRRTNDRTPLATGIAEPGSTVVLTRDGVVVATVTSNSLGVWTATITATPLADGPFVVVATATDLAGNRAVSSSATVTIDGMAPLPPVVTAIGIDTGTVGDFLTSDQTLIFSGTAEANSVVTVMLDGLAIGSAVTSGSGSWTFDFTAVTLPGSPLAGGRTYVVTATATDAAGNVSLPSADRSIGIDAGTADGTVILAVTDDTGVIGDGLTNDTTLVISGIAEPGSTVQVLDNGVVIGIAIAGPTGLWTLNATFPAGDLIHPLTAVATDVAGNVAPPSPLYSLHIDTVAPAAPVITGVGRDTALATDFITADQTLVVSGTAEAGATVTVMINGTVVGTAVANAGGVWSLDLTGSPFTDAAYVLSATATDVAGNVGLPSANQPLVIDTTISVPLLLTCGPDSNVVGDLVTNINQQTLRGIAEPGATVTVILDGVIIGTVVADSSGAWSFGPTAPLTDGAHVFTATAVDVAGNQSLVSAPLTVVIDTVATIAIAAVSPGTFTGTGAAVTGTTSPTLSGTTDAGATVSVTVDGVIVGSVVADATGYWSLALSGLTEGNHRIVATGFNLAGNTSPLATLALRVDLTAPVAVVITGLSADGVAIAQGGDCLDLTPTLTGSAEPGARVEVYADGVLLGSTIASSTGAWSFTVVDPIIKDGMVVFTVIAVDVAGNRAPASGPWTVQLLQTRSVEIAPNRCGIGSNFAIFGMLFLVLRLSLRGASQRAGGRVALFALALALPFAASVSAAEEPTPVMIAYGAKWLAPVVTADEAASPVAPTAEWYDVRLLVGSMPKPDQDASYLRGGLSPGDSSWGTSVRIDLQGMRQDRQWVWGGLVYGAGLGWFKIDGSETPATTVQTAFDYRINAVPLDVTAGVRVDLNQRWWLEARGIVGAGPTLLSIDLPSSSAGNLQAASGSTVGLYTEYGAALSIVRRSGHWEAGLEGRWLQGRHSAAFERREFINGTLVSSEPYEVRLNQTGFALSFMLGRWF